MWASRAAKMLDAFRLAVFWRSARSVPAASCRPLAGLCEPAGKLICSWYSRCNRRGGHHWSADKIANSTAYWMTNTRRRSGRNERVLLALWGCLGRPVMMLVMLYQCTASPLTGPIAATARWVPTTSRSRSHKARPLSGNLWPSSSINTSFLLTGFRFRE
jgi:hypothetical protein